MTSTRTGLCDNNAWLAARMLWPLLCLSNSTYFWSARWFLFRPCGSHSQRLALNILCQGGQAVLGDQPKPPPHERVRSSSANAVRLARVLKRINKTGLQEWNYADLMVWICVMGASAAATTATTAGSKCPSRLRDDHVHAIIQRGQLVAHSATRSILQHPTTSRQRSGNNPLTQRDQRRECVRKPPLAS